MRHAHRHEAPGRATGPGSLFAGAGEVRARCRRLDWSATPLGPVELWPAPLRTAVRICLDAGVPACVFGGPDLVLIFNDGFAAALAVGERERALGRPAREVALEGLGDAARVLASLLAGGPPAQLEHRRVAVAHDGSRRETFWNIALSAVRDEEGRCAAILGIAMDSTAQVHPASAVGARDSADGAALADGEHAVGPRFPGRRSLQDRGARFLSQSDSQALYLEILEAAMDVMGADAASLQSHDPEDESLVLQAWVGIHPESAAFWQRVGAGGGTSCGQALARGERVLFDAIECERADLDDADLREFRRSGIRAVQSTPLLSRTGRRLGMISTHWRRSHRPAEGDFRLFDVLARQAADLIERIQAEAVLRESDACYHALFDSMDEAYAVVEVIAGADGRWSDFRFLDVNPAFMVHTGMPYPVGRTATQLLGTPNPHWAEIYGRVADTGDAVRIEETEPTLDRTFDLNIFRLGGEGSRRVAVLFTNVTERKRAEAALRESEARFRAVVDLVPDLLWQSEPDGAMRWYNARWYEYTGQSFEHAVGWGWTDAIHPDDRARAAANYAGAAARGEALVHQHRIRSRDGAYRWFLVRAEPLRDDAGKIVRWFGAATDVHAQRMALDDVEQLVTERTLQRDALRRQLAEAEEGERRRLARELHDQFGQELTALRLGLDEAIRLSTAHDGPRASDDGPLALRLRHLQALATRLRSGARAIALELRPPELDDVGLESALETYVSEWSARYSIPAEFATALRGQRIPSEVASALYRIAQEALTNVAKHADASQVSVIMEQPNGEVRLIVEDDGRGFDVEETMVRARFERRLGLAGMRERAALLGGTVTVESRPGGGTALYVRLPVEAHDTCSPVRLPREGEAARLAGPLRQEGGA